MGFQARAVRMDRRPLVVRFRRRLKRPTSKVLLATLAPILSLSAFDVVVELESSRKKETR